MASINAVTIMGNLGQEPEIRYTQSGVAVVTLSIATNRTYTDKDGNKHDQVEWHRCVVWGKSAEAVHEHKKKGDEVIIVGHLRTRRWEGEDGVARYTTEVHAGNWDGGGCKFTSGGARRGAPSPSDDDRLRSSDGPPPGGPPPGDNDIPF